MECYNVIGETDDHHHPHDIHIPESKGSWGAKGTILSNDKFMNPHRTKKVNIGSPENPKFSNNGDYCHDETIGKITDLLHEF